MKLHTSEELRNYCDALETNKRMGAKFWRDGFGVETKEQARAILASDLDNYLRPAMRNLAEVLIVRSSIAADDVKRDLHKHIINAFPTLKAVGMVVRKGNNAKPTKAFADVPDTTITVSRDLENGLTFSACISWRYADTKDITDSTTESLPMIGESAPSQAGINPVIATPKSMGTRIDLAYTPEKVGELIRQVDSNARKDSINRRSIMMASSAIEWSHGESANMLMVAAMKRFNLIPASQATASANNTASQATASANNTASQATASANNTAMV